MPFYRMSGAVDLQPIYDAIIARGVTPASDSVEDLAAAIALVDTTHSVNFYARYRGNTSIEYWIRVDGSQRVHDTATEGTADSTITV